MDKLQKIVKKHYKKLLVSTWLLGIVIIFFVPTYNSLTYRSSIFRNIKSVISRTNEYENYSFFAHFSHILYFIFMIISVALLITLIVYTIKGKSDKKLVKLFIIVFGLSILYVYLFDFATIGFYIDREVTYPFRFFRGLKYKINFISLLFLIIHAIPISLYFYIKYLDKKEYPTQLKMSKQEQINELKAEIEKLKKKK